MTMRRLLVIGMMGLLLAGCGTDKITIAPDLQPVIVGGRQCVVVSKETGQDQVEPVPGGLYCMMERPQEQHPILGWVDAIPEPFWVRSWRTLWCWRPACYKHGVTFRTRNEYDEHYLKEDIYDDGRNQATHQRIIVV